MENFDGAARWQAVQSRDRSADGAFVYAVRSTGVYCRPSCPSRKPRREQVVFFALAEAAEQKGFRALSALPPAHRSALGSENRGGRACVAKSMLAFSPIPTLASRSLSLANPPA